MRSAHFAFLVLSLLPPGVLTGCQGTKVTVVVNRLKPGMLKGKTVGIEGMEITASQWPGRDIDGPILCEAEKALRPVLKGARVCLLSEAGVTYESTNTGKAQETTTAASSKIKLNQADYIFRIMLRADSLSSRDEIRRDAYYRRGGASSRGGGIMPGLLSPGYRPGGYFLGEWGAADFSGYSWRKIAKRTLKADYILSDARTCKLIWKAEAVSTDVYVNVGNSVFGYRAPPYQSSSDLESKLPLNPLWISMNAAAVRSIR